MAASRLYLCTPIRPDLADEMLRGRIEAERFAAGELYEIADAIVPMHSAARYDAGRMTELLYGERVKDVTKHPAFRNTARMIARESSRIGSSWMKRWRSRTTTCPSCAPACRRR